jgi:CobQ-like glutamine amidotransferase family enzyme
LAEPLRVPGAELTQSLTGYENHAGGTTLGTGAHPLARVRAGVGNGVADVVGAVQGHVLGTYLPGPGLARNPELADLLLSWVVGQPLAPLDMPAVAALRAERLAAVKPLSTKSLSVKSS